MDTGTFVIVQTDIAIKTSPIRQINIVARIQVERTIHQGRIFREELHADTSSTECRIDSQIHAFFFPRIEILEKQLRLSITYITIQVYFKGFLIRLGCADDFGQEIQSVFPMLQVDAYSIYHQTVGTYFIQVSFTIYPFFRRSVEVQMKAFERNALHQAQIVADRVNASRSGFQTNSGQICFQFFLVDGLGSPLLIGTDSECIQLADNVLYISPSIEVHIQVASTHIRLGRVYRSSKTYIQVLGLECLFRCFDRRIGHRSIHFVFLFKVAHESYIKLMRRTERHVHELHNLPVEFRHLYLQMRRHIVRLQLSIKVRLYFHSRVASHERSIQLMILERSSKVVTSQSVSGIMQFIHRSCQIETGFGRKEIKSFPIGMEFHGYIENRILRKELMYIEVVHHHICQIRVLRQIILGIKSGGTTHLEIFCQGKRIVVNRQLGTVHQSFRPGFRLLQEHIYTHFRTCHGKDTLQVCTSAKRQTAVCQRSQEAHIECFGSKVDFPTPASAISEMQQVTLRLQFERFRQSGFQGAETETIQIAFGIDTETERFLRISLQKERIPSTQHFRHIAFTDFG